MASGEDSTDNASACTLLGCLAGVAIQRGLELGPFGTLLLRTYTKVLSMTLVAYIQCESDEVVMGVDAHHQELALEVGKVVILKPSPDIVVNKLDVGGGSECAFGIAVEYTICIGRELEHSTYLRRGGTPTYFGSLS